MPAIPEPRAWSPIPDPMRPVPLPVRQVARETGDTFSLVLDPGPTGFRFRPGQFDMLWVPGVGEVPVSISGDPARPEVLVHTIRAVGAVTRRLQKLRPGDWVGVRGPFGTPWPLDELQGHDVVIVAGGIGLAPLRPALFRILDRRSQYEKVVLLYGARTPKDLLFSRELREWRGRFDIEVEVTVDRASMDWKGPVGVVTRLLDRAPFDPAGAAALVCGPEVMTRFALQSLERRGVDTASIFISMERNMKCAVGLCGHCQYGPTFICRDGPVFPYQRIQPLFGVEEV